MQKFILFISILIFTLVSCVHGKNVKSDKKIHSKIQNTKKAFFEIDLDSISFAYNIESVQEFNEKYDGQLKCTLFNNDTNTLFIYTMSCYGWEEAFLYDTSKITIFKSRFCEFSKPIIKEIAPKSKLTFTIGFSLKQKQKSSEFPRIEYYIYKVNSDFDINDKESIAKLEKTVIHNKNNILQLK